MVCNSRKSLICLPILDDSLSSDEHHKTSEHLPRTSKGLKTKVYRKSRKQTGFSFNCKQISVGVQTESNRMIVGPQQLQSTCDNNLVSTGTQTDNVIVINVSQQSHAAADDFNGLFKAGHSGLLPALRISSEYSAGCDQDTDSGHTSDADNRLSLSAATVSTDVDSKEINKGAVTYTPLSAVPMHHGSKEMNGADIIRHSQLTTESVRHGSHEATTVLNKTLSTASCKLSSVECSQLSRWTTATRLDILDESDTRASGRQQETFFAPLETSDSQHAVVNDADMSGIFVLSNDKEANVLSSSSEMSSISSPAKSLASHVSHGIVGSSSNRLSQSIADTRCHVLKVSRIPCGKTHQSNSSSGSLTHPPVDTPCRVSKGSTQRCAKPRLSVGRKSLSRRRSSAVHNKCHTSTKISRPAAWLMNAAKAGRSKVLVQQLLCSFLHFS